MKGDFHAPFCGSPGVRSPRATRRLMTGIVIQKTFVDGPDVLTWYDLHTTQAGPLPTVNWRHVENGKITWIRVTFDPRPLTSSQ